MKADAVIIGSGIAAFAAATLSPKKCNLAIVSQSVGATALSSGAWDFGPMHPGKPYQELRNGEPWKKTFQKILIGSPEERQNLATEPQIQNLIRRLGEVIEPENAIQFRMDQPYCLPTSMGNWKYTFGAQKIQTPLDLQSLVGKRIALISARGWRFQAPLILDQMRSFAKRLGGDLSIELWLLEDFYLGEDCSLSHVATRLNSDPTLLERFRDELKNRLKHSPMDAFAFPPLFLQASTLMTLEADLGVLCGECLSTHEPIAGFRLSETLKNSLAGQGIKTFRTKTVQIHTQHRHITGLRCSLYPHGDVMDIDAERYILATGKLLSGGVRIDAQQVSEPLLGLPLYTGDDRPIHYRSELTWTDRKFFEEQDWAKVGVWVDNKFRPIERARGSLFDNLFACGSIIGGVDYAKENLGLGFLAYTGMEVGNTIT